jgi:hypothetical protein
MRTRVLLAAALVACAGPRPRVPRGEVVVSFEGAVEHGPFRFGKDDLPGLPQRGFKAVSPLTGKEASFEGLSVAAVIADEMELSPGVDTAIFHGRDGYAAPVPIAALRQLRPVLAYRVNDAPVGEWSKEAAPLQLAWPNVDQPGIDSDPRMRWWWVGGVERVELRSWVATYGKALRVPQGSSDEARLGAEAISLSCIACHKVRGVGGTRGPELRSQAVQGDRGAFSETIRKHLSSVSGMDSAPETSGASARQIAAFLQVIDLPGGRPEEDTPPEQPPAAPRAPRAGDPLRQMAQM